MDNYYQHYGLQHDPFPREMVDDLFFSTADLEHRLGLVKHLIEFSDRFVVITGAVGSGKTSVLKHLANTANEKWRICSVSFNDVQTTEDFILKVYQDQHLVYEKTEPLAKKVIVLQDHFRKIQENDLFPVLMIDDGHRLSMELLKILIELAVSEYGHPGLRVILFSEADLADLISHRNIGYIHSVDLPPFSEEQLIAYIDFRLQEVGHHGEIKLINEKLLKQIYKASDGLPGLINELAAKALNDPVLSQAESPVWSRFTPYLLNRKVTIPIALLLIVGIIVFILQVEETEVKNTRIEVALPAEQKENENELKTKSGDEDVVEGSDELYQAGPLAVEEERLDVIENSEKVLLTIPEEVGSEEVVNEVSRTSEESDEDENEQISFNNIDNGLVQFPQVNSNPTVEPANRIEIAVPIQSANGVQAAPTVIESASVVAEADITPEPIGQTKTIVEGPVEEEQQVVEVKREPIKQEPIKQEPVKQEPVKQGQVKEEPIKEEISDALKSVNSSQKQVTIRDNSWLKKQSAEHYVLQLMGAHDENLLNQFIVKYPELRKDMTKFKTVNQNKAWHVLLLGIYENRDLAVAAILRLPSKIRDLKPWPRKIQTIQKDL